jgi:CSLREA domain-containing protein
MYFVRSALFVLSLMLIVFTQTDAQIDVIGRPINVTINTTADTADAAPGNQICADTDGACSLRAAIEEANSVSDGSVINIPAGYYQIDEYLQISRDMRLIGAGADQTVIYGKGRSRVMAVSRNALELYDLALVNGYQAQNNGGGLYAYESDVRMERVVIANSRVGNTRALVEGGGFYGYNGSLYMANSAVINSQSTETGGGITLKFVRATLENVTLSGNSSGIGGGLYVEGGQLISRHVTYARNSASIEGGGIYFAETASTNYYNSLIVENTAPIGPDCFGTMGDGRRNLISNNSGCVTGSYIVDGDPTIAALAMNTPGSVPSHALLPNGPAIDAGASDWCLETDIRGVPRPLGPGCDIGAYELRNIGRAVTKLTPANRETIEAIVDSQTQETNSFTWRHDLQSEWYNLKIDEVGRIINDVWYEASEICYNSFEGTFCNVNIPPTLPNGAYTWRVRGWSDLGFGPEDSQPFDFALLIPAPLVQSPSAAIVHGRPQISWAPSDVPIAWYEFILVNSAGQVAYSEWIEAAVAVECDDDCQTLLEFYGTPGTHDLYMRGYSFHSGLSPYSDGTAVNVPGAATALPADLAIRNGYAGGLVTFEWSATDTTSWFQIWTGTNNTFQQLYYGWHDAAQICDADNRCTLTLPLNPAPGEYVWYVQSYGSGGLSTGGIGNSGFAEGPVFTIP